MKDYYKKSIIVLYEFIKKIHARIFENTCYKQCIEIIIKKCGKISKDKILF